MLFADKQTVSTLMQTCRILHREGTKHLLRDVMVLEAPQLLSVLEFLKAPSDLNRWPFLRSLDIFLDTSDVIEPWFAEAVDELLFGLLAVSKLDSLALELDAETLLSLQPRLVQTIAAFTTLRRLSMQGCGPRSAAMIRNMHSTLTSASIEFKGDGSYSEEEDRDMDFIRLLHHSHATLESISVYFPGMTLPGGPIYPKVEYIYLETPLYYPQPMHYIRSFPNLSTLIAYDDEGMDRSERAFLKRRRPRIKRKQEKHGSWPSLTSYGGYIGPLWSFALTCHIVELRTEVATDYELDMLLDVLPDARPRALILSVSGRQLFMKEALISALCEPRDPPLKSLEIEIKMWCGPGDQLELSVSEVTALLVSSPCWSR